MKYTVIIEKDDSSYDAFVPDFPGCIAVGETKKEVIELILEAVEFHEDDWLPKASPIKV